MIDWKSTTIMNDILYRQVAIPRWVLIVDTSPYDPRTYSGTKEARKLAAKNDAKAAMTSMSNDIAKYEPDQMYMLSIGSELKLVEPSSAAYNDPNELISQIDNIISGTVGIPSSATGGKSEAQASAQNSTQFLTIHAEALLDTVARSIIKLFKLHLATKYPAFNTNESAPLTDSKGHYVCKKYSKKLLRRIKYKKTKIMIKDRAEQMSIISNMVATKAFSFAEARSEAGYDPMTDSEFKEHIKEMTEVGLITKTDTGFRPQSPEATAGQMRKNPPTSPNEQLPSEREHDRLRRVEKDRNVSGKTKEE